MKTMIALLLVAMAVTVRGQLADNGTAAGMNNTGNATATADDSGSSLSVYPFINGVLAVLGPCTGLQIHTHDQTEYATADPNNRNPLKMVYINPTGEAVVVNVPPGGTLVIPAGLLHYQINYGCSSSTFLGTFRRPAITELVLPSLAAMPDVLVYLNLTGINGTAGNSMMANGTGASMGGGMSATDNAGALANVTAAVTNSNLFVVNPVCAQTCA
jgi:hypothetical protein